MKTMTLTRTIALVAALACAKEVRAQGDLDILLRTVPPIVMIQLDTSGSMSNVTLPAEYLAVRGAALPPPANPFPSIWFNTPTDGSTPADGIPRLAARVVNGSAASLTNYNPAGGNGYNSSGSTTATTQENYQRTCQLFAGQSTASTGSICYPGAGPGNSPLCRDDDSNGSSPQSGWRIRCWEMPGAAAGSCPALVPTALYTGAGGSCTTINRNRQRGTTVAGTATFTSRPYTTIVLPNFSAAAGGATTDYPANYLWWMLNEIYNNRTPAFIAQDRMVAAKQAVTALVNQMNVDGQNPRVKFGLARYSGENGGYIVVPASLTSKAAILTAIDNVSDSTELPASGLTPLSEALVDVARYLAGSSRFGDYPQYNRNVTGGTSAPIPPSPITSECEKVFIVVVTDGLPTCDGNNHYGTNFSTTMAGFIDGDPVIPAPTTTCSPAATSSPDSLDDVAAKLFDMDLRPPGTAPINGVQNAITYTVGFAVDAPLLQDAADRGDGTYYASNDATELGNALALAVNDILLRNTTLTAANVPANRSAFGDGFYTAYFEPGAQRSLWPGHLQAFTVNQALDVVDAGGAPAIDPLTDLFIEPRNPHWDLADTLISDYASRTIYTTKAGVRTLFTPDPGITPTDLGVLLSEEPQYPQDPNNPDFTTAEELTDAIVNFVHGFDAFDEDDDGSVVDAREFVLGDIFHSNPIAIGPPLNFLRFETGYGPASDVNSFMGTYGRRDRVLYVGANDGMLHGVYAGSFYDPNTSVAGDESYTAGVPNRELFGYVPGIVLPKIKQLPKVGTGKEYFVDGPSSAADVWIDYDGDSIKEGSDWTTVLLTPLREGGEGVLALDVTDPGATAGNHGPYPRLMWEFTHANLGETWSKPIVTRVKLRAGFGVGDRCGANNGDGNCVEEWVAIFGAGYRQQGDPNLSLYTNDPNNPTYTRKGRGVYMVRVRDGAILSSIAQDPNSATYSKMRYAIPAEPAVLDLNFDGFADVVYIGDLGGQLWKWDISTVGLQVSGVVPNTDWPAGVVFEAPVATTAGGVLHYHSIFQSAAAAFNEGDLWLSFASGERANLGYAGQADPNNPTSLVGLYDDNNRFWVLKDRTPTGTGAFPTTLPNYEEPLMPATVPLPGHGSLTDVTNVAQDPNDLDEGYFFRVPDGEKFMTNHLIFDGIVYTASYKPELGITPPAGSCALGGTTSAWGFELDDAGASFDDPVNVNQFVRTVTIGNGAPTDPKITVGPDGVRITLQTSTGEVLKLGDPPPLDLVDMIYWRQNF